MSTPDINDFARETLVLERIVFCRHNRLEGVLAVELQFKDDRRITFRNIPETDELEVESAMRAGVETEDLAGRFPFVSKAYGCCLRWAWKMRNHQGYQDAIQLEFTDEDMVTTAIVQFKAVGSYIYVCEVKDMSL